MTDWAWDERFREGEYPVNAEPSPLLKRFVATLDGGRALDVATGTGRNAVYLAEHGHDVVGLDRSIEGLRLARERATERGVEDRCAWVQTDLGEHTFAAEAYDLITVSFFRVVDRLPDVMEALRPGGVLFVEHHLRTTDEVAVGPVGERYRFGANELLHGALSLTVLHFETRTERRDDGRRSAVGRVVARKTHGQRQSYPEVPDSVPDADSSSE
ncbi:class I SAM-dependent methyltransferase [Salinirubellus salinus]|jgi:protein-L-isoaspartate O-methyltransferase|uniref:Class I SAM-dependent methyltransferase n=1 Tax=Salinirubellus salinus TaxID=1364945 RepID=A0A9E7U9W0_9EURY|nr:class I SAM-dependent methyltransferase [Salinirubellus salinus]UWM53254.1 class I SAM-dependent methyltransferase [Salinirubellus salinus]